MADAIIYNHFDSTSAKLAIRQDAISEVESFYEQGMMKICSRCHLEKSIKDFPPNKRYKLGVSSWCRQCYRGYSKTKTQKERRQEYHCANKSKINARIKRRRWENIELFRKERRNYWAENAEQRRRYEREYWAKNRDRRRKQTRDWYKRNPEKRRVKVQRQKQEREQSIGAGLSFEDWEKIKDIQGHACAVCGVREPDVRLTIDHVIPLHLSGRHEPENIAALCKSCNSSKGIRILPNVVPAFMLWRKWDEEDSG